MLKDKTRGSLIGGAAGDALGYAIEFLGEYEIFKRYGNSGIREYSLDSELRQCQRQSTDFRRYADDAVYCGRNYQLVFRQ